MLTTPVKNESSILDTFLTAAREWADHVIVLDHLSTDGSGEIARRHVGVQIIQHPHERFDEDVRRSTLVEAARALAPPRVIFAIDADELLTPTWSTSEAWRSLDTLDPGTIVEMRWVNLLPGGEKAWIPNEWFGFAYVDDGAPHTAGKIHSGRLPGNSKSPRFRIDDVLVLHLQFLNWPRMKSKQRWYQCWEVVNGFSKRPIQLYRQYHRMEAIPDNEIFPVNDAWIGPRERTAMEQHSSAEQAPFRWDGEVVDWLIEHGPKRFRKLDIWDVDWEDLALRTGRTVSPDSLRDPRDPFIRFVHGWLRKTQIRAGDPWIRWMQRLLIPLGW